MGSLALMVTLTKINKSFTSLQGVFGFGECLVVLKQCCFAGKPLAEKG